MLKHFTRSRFALTLAALCVVAGLSAQQRAPRETALTHLRTHASQFGLTAQDVADVQITDEYLSKKSQVTHVWAQQQYAGIPVLNALFGLHVLPSGEVATTSHRFVSNLDQKINTNLPSLGAAKALELAMRDLGFGDFEVPRLKQKINEKNLVFEGGAVSLTDIPVSASFVVDKKDASFGVSPKNNSAANARGTVRIAWTLLIEQANTADLWSISVDAQTGDILEKHNRTVYCQHEHAGGGSAHSTQCFDAPETTATANSPLPTVAAPVVADGSSYRVFAWPVESPAHGARELLLNPANPTASPFGWHDTNGADGAEYTYSRGNNVWAYDDIANDNTGTEAESISGGATLTFDFPFSNTVEPQANRASAITNLFYVNNMMHDFSYVYGFDEAAGNFQTNTYGNGGTGNDAVRAEAIDGGGIDNANFATLADGAPPRMQMYRWSRSGGNLITINSPSEIAGGYFGQAATDWGGQITTTPITGDVVVANDGTADGTLGCGNSAIDLTGKIVLVDRGICQFGQKALEAEQAGAKACIICNFENSTAGMAVGDFGSSVTIPVVMMAKNNCDAMKQYILQGGVNMTLVEPAVTGPDFLDGDFDNGIIAHEYGHGISNRLTGGPAAAGCLGNDEQMGEGWSDWFTLVTTRKPTDVATTKRGVGTYVQREANDGTGIRRYPYNTDMSISPLTYGNVAESVLPHGLGEIWAGMTWDLYWAMVDQYGYDADWTNTDSGNGRAIQLVMEGMKLQPCSPGFQDGRDAIILADKILYGGVDTCLITGVFARRGLGINSSQGLTTSASDGKESFEPIEVCIKELKIKKETSTPTIDPWATVQFKITVTNHKDAAVTNVTVSDELPAGLTLASASNGGVAAGNAVVWDLGTINTGQTVTLTYSANANGNGSARLYRDEMEDDADWLSLPLTGDNFFSLQTSMVQTGFAAWRCDNQPVINDLVLEKNTTLNVGGARPTLRFWNNFNTEKGADAGFLEFRTSENQPWKRLTKAETFRTGYTGGVQYATIAIPFLQGFSGDSEGWKQSYLDLSQFAGQDVFLRYRFVSDDNTSVDGWVFDDVELLDLVNYDGEVCVTSAEGDQVCTRVPDRGVIVNPASTGTNDQTLSAFGLSVQPNPASDMLYLTVTEAVSGLSQVTMIGADGRVALTQRVPNGLVAGQPLALNVREVPAGVYFLRLESGAGVSTVKVVVK